MRNRSVWLLAGFVLVASLIIGPGATASPQKATAGTVVFIHDPEPPNLQGPWVGNNLYATSLVLNNIWYGCQIRDATASFVPRLCEAKPTLVKKSPLTVSFKYKQSAVWSDGKPVVAEDFYATWKVFTNPANNVISRTGWEDIASVTRGNSKKVTVVFKKVYADWESLVSSGPYAAVRHPMYTAAIILYVATPLALASWWGLVPASLLVAVIVWRLIDEEAYLARHLAGYVDYRQRVRARLVPGVW